VLRRHVGEFGVGTNTGRASSITEAVVPGRALRNAFSMRSTAISALTSTSAMTDAPAGGTHCDGAINCQPRQHVHPGLRCSPVAAGPCPACYAPCGCEHCLRRGYLCLLACLLAFISSMRAKLNIFTSRRQGRCWSSRMQMTCQMLCKKVVKWRAVLHFHRRTCPVCLAVRSIAFRLREAPVVG
jgi:hypothetical protein